MSTSSLSAASSAKRLSCDRCHNMKSRCSRTSGFEKCHRCERYGMTCIYSAPLPMGRPKGNGSNITSNQDSTDSNRASQDSASRGRKNSGRTMQSPRQREFRCEKNTTQGEHSHTVSVLDGQVQEKVTEDKNSESGSVTSSLSNSWDDFVSAPEPVQNTALLSATLDTSSPSEGIW